MKITQQGKSILESVTFWGSIFTVCQLTFINRETWCKLYDYLSLLFMNHPLSSKAQITLYCFHHSTCVIVFGSLSLFFLDKYNNYDRL